MTFVQFKHHDADGDVFINTAHVPIVEASAAGDGDVTDIVVGGAQAGLGRLRPGAHRVRWRHAAPPDARPSEPQDEEDRQNRCRLTRTANRVNGSELGSPGNRYLGAETPVRHNR